MYCIVCGKTGLLGASFCGCDIAFEEAPREDLDFEAGPPVARRRPETRWAPRKAPEALYRVSSGSPARIRHD